MNKKLASGRESSKPSAWMKEQPVGQALRDAYNDVMNEPVPERFRQLVQRMREMERTEK